MSRTAPTHESWHPQTREDRDAILRELETILASPQFSNSKRYPAFLRYVVENTLENRSDLLKERNLGVEVFDRPPTYDTNTDTVVRYTAGEVRKRLLLYYSDPGRAAKIHISLPAGSYVPEFSRVDIAEYGATRNGAHAASDAVIETSSSSETNSHAVEGAFGRIDEGATSDPSLEPGRLLPRTPHVLWPWLWLVLLVLLAIGGSLAFWHMKSRAQGPASAIDEFWAPMLNDQHMVVICAGSVVFAQDNYSGVVTAGGNTDYPFFSMQTVSAITAINPVLLQSGATTKLLSAPSTPLNDLREHSVVLLGAYNNQWTMRLLEPFRFHFNPNPVERIVDSRQPQVSWERDETEPYSSTDDYALVARFHDARIDGWVVALAGIGRNGTEAAAQFVTNPHYLEVLRQQIGSGFGNRNVEVVLKVNVINGETGAPTILAIEVW